MKLTAKIPKVSVKYTFGTHYLKIVKTNIDESVLVSITGSLVNIKEDTTEVTIEIGDDFRNLIDNEYVVFVFELKSFLRDQYDDFNKLYGIPKATSLV